MKKFFADIRRSLTKLINASHASGAPNGMLVKFDRQAHQEVRKIREYLEFKDDLEVIKSALAYYSMHLDLVTREYPGEIVHRDFQGFETKTDPITHFNKLPED